VGLQLRPASAGVSEIQRASGTMVTVMLPRDFTDSFEGCATVQDLGAYAAPALDPYPADPFIWPPPGPALLGTDLIGRSGLGVKPPVPAAVAHLAQEWSIPAMTVPRVPARQSIHSRRHRHRPPGCPRDRPTLRHFSQGSLARPEVTVRSASPTSSPQGWRRHELVPVPLPNFLQSKGPD
jgi:hypothetical protein